MSSLVWTSSAASLVAQAVMDIDQESCTTAFASSSGVSNGVGGSARDSSADAQMADLAPQSEAQLAAESNATRVSVPPLDGTYPLL